MPPDQPLSPGDHLVRACAQLLSAGWLSILYPVTSNEAIIDQERHKLRHKSVYWDARTLDGRGSWAMVRASITPGGVNAQVMIVNIAAMAALRREPLVDGKGDVQKVNASLEAEPHCWRWNAV